MKSVKIIYTGIAISILSFLIASCVKDYDNPAKGTLGEFITLFALRQSYHGNEITLAPGVLGGATKIQGVVISDKNGLNTETGSFVLQETISVANSVTDVTRGIIVKLASGTPSYAPGDSVSVNIDGAKLDRVNGKLIITGVNPDKIAVIDVNKTPLVQDVTQGLLHLLMDQYESTLVSLHADATEYAAGVTFSGLKKLRDNTGPEVYLQTLTSAIFATTQIPINAGFRGIAGFYNATGKDTTGAKKTISIRNNADIQFPSGALYAGFPESFESPNATEKASYNSGTNIATLSTGNWYLLQAILGNTIISDKFNQPGKQSIRMQQNLTTSGYVQMNFDLPDGASKVTFFYGKYATDARSSLRLEYSVNGGTTWIALGTNLTDMPEKGNKQASYSMSIAGPVRFRINKLGIGTSNNGRLCIDDFAVYKNL